MGLQPADLNIVLLFVQDETAERVRHILARRPEFRLFLIRETPDLLLAPTYDIHPRVVVVGPQMPTLQKIRWITRLRAVLPDVGIVAIGEYHDEQYGLELIAYGANAFVGGDELDSLLIPAIMDAAGRRL